MNKNMIVGNPTKSLILFAIPMILGQLCQQIYSLADTMIVGRTIGQNALGAVGSAASVCWVYVSIALGLGIGCSVIISQLFGAGQYTKMKTAINTSIISMIGLSLIFLVIGLLTCDFVLYLMRTPAELLSDSKSYYIIYILGFPGLFMYNIANSIFNALGKSKIPLAFLACSAALNIGLDFWLILGLKLGVAGAAIATIISQYIAAVLSFIVLLRYIKKNCVITEKAKFFEGKMLAGIAKVAIPTMLTQTVLSLGIVIMQSLVNSFGPDVMAGFAAAGKIDGLAIVPMIQIGNAVSTFAAQNMGANQLDRVKSGYKAGLVMTTIVSVTLAVIMLIFCKPFVGAFMDSTANAHAIQVGAEYVQIVCVFYIIMGFMNTTCGILRGTGDIMPTMVSLLVNFGVRIAFAYILTAIFASEIYIWWAQPIGWFLGFVIAYVRYKGGKWKTKSLVRKM